MYLTTVWSMASSVPLEASKHTKIALVFPEVLYVFVNLNSYFVFLEFIQDNLFKFLIFGT